jgi:hypothetical protein
VRQPALLAGVSAEAACEILHKAFPRRRAVLLTAAIGGQGKRFDGFAES